MKTIITLFILSAVISANIALAEPESKNSPVPNSSEGAAISGPLGSWNNPVKSNGPSGERAYIKRLKCPDGETPKFHRVGSYAPGPYGNILDGYDLVCGDQKFKIFMDMYHCCFKETEPVPGFTIEPPSS